MLIVVPCPPTRWADCGQLWREQLSQPRSASLPPASVPWTVTRPAESTAINEYEWLQQNAAEHVALLADHGAIHFRGLKLPETVDGFCRFCEALPFVPCDDPLASVRVRAILSKSRGLYEAVNAPSLANTYIGLHNDATLKKTAPFAAFVCLQPATEGGEFLLADGSRVLQSLDPDVLQRLCERQMRVRVARLPVPPLLHVGPLRPPLEQLLATIVQAALGVATPLDLEVVPTTSNESPALQIFERSKPPVNRHPRTREPSFFSGIHSQSRYLQSRRPGLRFEGVASTDVLYGDFGAIPEADLVQIEGAVLKNVVWVRMQKGDVVLLDSYRMLHGRDVFQGPRQHAVRWMTSDDF